MSSSITEDGSLVYSHVVGAPRHSHGLRCRLLLHHRVWHPLRVMQRSRVSLVPSRDRRSHLGAASQGHQSGSIRHVDDLCSRGQSNQLGARRCVHQLLVC